MLLHQRGRLVLHASAVAMNGGGALFLGASGWGKSTLLAALAARGHSPVADDVAAVDADAAHPVLLPGIPQLKLLPETVSFLGSDAARWARVHSRSEKRVQRLPKGDSQSTFPVRRIYVLAGADDGAPAVVPLSRREAVIELVRHTYTAQLLPIMGDSARHFRQCARVAEQVPARERSGG